MKSNSAPNEMYFVEVDGSEVTGKALLVFFTTMILTSVLGLCGASFVLTEPTNYLAACIFLVTAIAVVFCGLRWAEDLRKPVKHHRRVNNPGTTTITYVKK